MKKLLSICVLALIMKTASFAQCNPATPSIIAVVDDSVSIAWGAVSGALGYEYVILPSTSPQPPSGQSTTALKLDTNGLQYQTYKIWLRSDCGSSIFSTWSYVTFTVSCGSPAMLLTVLHDTSADFTWNAISGSASYEYVIDQVPGNPTAAGVPLTGTSIHIGGLFGGTPYYMHTRTKCTSTAYSPWSTYAFTTPFPLAINNITGNGINIYPNPIFNELNIGLAENKGNIIITNVVGTVIYSTTVSNTKFSIDMSAYPAGLYLLRYSNGTTLHTIKLNKL